jgi:nuclear transport factor 2 (NTF2) superfamily protein
MAVPDDPTGFVAAAERGINERDLDATARVYADDARLENFFDGAREEHRGADDIRRAWSGYLEAMGERDFRLKKQLQTVGDDIIVNDWTGTLGDRTEEHGIESWRFDESGKVVEHRMFSFMNVKPADSPLQRLRLAMSYPISALAFLRAQRRVKG